MMMMALAFVGMLVIVVFIAGIITVVVARIYFNSELVETEPIQIDDTPLMRCPQCTATWVDGLGPIHEANCAAAYIRGETRRLKGS